MARVGSITWQDACHIKHILAADVKHIMAPQQQYARGAPLRFGRSGQMGVGLGCYAEPKQGRLVRPVAKICFILRPLYALCDRPCQDMPQRLSQDMVEITPLDTNMVLCCTEKLCGGTNTAPQGAHPLYRLSTASKQKI